MCNLDLDSEKGKEEVKRCSKRPDAKIVVWVPTQPYEVGWKRCAENSENQPVPKGDPQPRREELLKSLHEATQKEKTRQLLKRF